jgi:phosphate transport system substrate-binding protein
MGKMNRNSPARAVLGLLSFLAMLSCNRSSNLESLQPAGGGSSVIGAGSTFIYPIMGRWISTFQGSRPGVKINYQSIGSGGGIQQLKMGLIDFGASDAAVNDQMLKEMPPLIQIPESAGPVCVTYNLPELNTRLQLSGATLAGIYLGRITNWQDPAVRNDNPGGNLPDRAILVAHRSDGSGTTSIFTGYLAKVSPEWAKVGQGVSVRWPVGLGGKGSEGVTGVVRQTPGSIAYVELTYAAENHLPVALIRNQAGNWEEPTPESTTAAIDAFQSDLARDVRTSIVDPPASARDAYPICGLTYLLVARDGSDVAKRRMVRDFIEFVVTDGQNAAVALQYARLPPALVKQDQKLIAEMQMNGHTVQESSPPSSL